MNVPRFVLQSKFFKKCEKVTRTFIWYKNFLSFTKSIDWPSLIFCSNSSNVGSISSHPSGGGLRLLRTFGIFCMIYEKKKLFCFSLMDTFGLTFDVSTNRINTNTHFFDNTTATHTTVTTVSRQKVRLMIMWIMIKKDATFSVEFSEQKLFSRRRDIFSISLTL